MMELQKGRPMDTTGRLAKETRTYDLLDSLGIEYNRIDHAPAMTMEVCQEIDKTLQAIICKNLFLCNRQETAFYLLMIPDTTPRIYPLRSTPHACPLPSRNIWKSSLISLPARSVCWA